MMAQKNAVRWISNQETKGYTVMPAGPHCRARYELVQGTGADANNWYLHSSNISTVPVTNATAVPTPDHLALALLAALLLVGAAAGMRCQH